MNKNKTVNELMPILTIPGKDSCRSENGSSAGRCHALCYQSLQWSVMASSKRVFCASKRAPLGAPLHYFGSPYASKGLIPFSWASLIRLMSLSNPRIIATGIVQLIYKTGCRPRFNERMDFQIPSIQILFEKKATPPGRSTKWSWYTQCPLFLSPI